MKAHTKRHRAAPPAAALKASRPFSIQESASPTRAEADLKAWQERAARYGHYFDGPALSVTASGPESVIQRKTSERPKTPEELAREEDRKKLSGMFTIDEDTKANPRRKSNVVTSKKFNEIADLYSRIREGNTSIKFAADQEPGFQEGVMKDVAKLLQTKGGRKLLEKVTTGEHTVTLEKAAEILDSEAPRDTRNPNRSKIQYVPGGELVHPESRKVVTTGDTTLFHELMHVHRRSKGMEIPGLLTEADLYRNHPDINVPKEEYAILGRGSHNNDSWTENAYRAEQASLQTNQKDKEKYEKRYIYNLLRPVKESPSP